MKNHTAVETADARAHAKQWSIAHQSERSCKDFAFRRLSEKQNDKSLLCELCDSAVKYCFRPFLEMDFQLFLDYTITPQYYKQNIAFFPKILRFMIRLLKTCDPLHLSEFAISAAKRDAALQYSHKS